MSQVWEILVPTLHRDGKPIRLRFHKVWDEKVRAISGGLTVLPPAKGQWLSPSGTLFAERMIPVRISCSEEKMHHIADMTLVYYDQEAVFYYLVTEKVFIKHRSDDASTAVR